MLVNMFCLFLGNSDLRTVFIKDQAPGGEVTAYLLTYIVGAYRLTAGSDYPFHLWLRHSMAEPEGSRSVREGRLGTRAPWCS